MDRGFHRKYKRVLDILPDVADCAQGNLVLVGGTALALFHLKHRVSVDLDFVPASGDDTKLKEGLKGCLSKKGYRTTTGAFKNQFVVQFEDTTIKVEVFSPERKIAHVEEHVFGARKIMVASLEDLLKMKVSAYAERREARDLFDIYCALKKMGRGLEYVKKLVTEVGSPMNMEDLEEMATDRADVAELRKVIANASS